MTHPPLADGYHAVPAGKLACIETSLQMLQPPPDRSRAPRPDLSLRRVSDPQPGWYRDLFRRVGAPWLWASRLGMTDAALSATIADADVEVFAAVHAGADQGLLELDFRQAGACELSFFGLVPALTGRGAGSWLMRHAVRRAWARPIGRFWVHTCTLDHPAALSFYQRSGFVPFRVLVEVADDPRQIGVLDPDQAPQIAML